MCKNSTEHAPKRAIFHSEVKQFSEEGHSPLPKLLPKEGKGKPPPYTSACMLNKKPS